MSQINVIKHSLEITKQIEYINRFDVSDPLSFVTIERKNKQFIPKQLLKFTTNYELLHQLSLHISNLKQFSQNVMTDIHDITEYYPKDLFHNFSLCCYLKFFKERSKVSLIKNVKMPLVKTITKFYIMDNMFIIEGIAVNNNSSRFTPVYLFPSIKYQLVYRTDNITSTVLNETWNLDLFAIPITDTINNVLEEYANELSRIN